MWDNFLAEVAAVVAASIVVVGIIWGAMAIGHRYRCKKHEWQFMIDVKLYRGPQDEKPSQTTRVYCCKHCGKIMKIESKA